MYFSFAVSLLCVTTNARAQSEGESDSDEARWSPFPVIMYSPETSLVLGGMAVFTFHIDDAGADRERRRSTVMVALAGSFKKQILLSVQPDLYIDQRTWHISAPTDFNYFPDTIYPPGNDTPDDTAENLTRLWFDTWPAVTHSVIDSLEAGVRLNITHATYLDIEPGGMLDSGELPGSDGGLYVGVGPVVVWDDRDNAMATYRGSMASLQAVFYQHAIGSTDNFTVVEADLRHFIEPWSEQVLGLQLYGRFSAGDVPVAKLSRLGGDTIMRGFFSGRYNGKHVISTQAEYRFPIWWRFRGAAFVGVGRVSQRLDKMALADLRVAGGLGLRFAMIPEDRVNIRLDFGATNTGEFNFYVNFAEAF
jgi:hypothetical protein